MFEIFISKITADIGRSIRDIIFRVAFNTRRLSAAGDGSNITKLVGQFLHRNKAEQNVLNQSYRLKSIPLSQVGT